MIFRHVQITEDLIGYIRNVSPPEPQCLRELREETASHPEARMQIPPEQANFMALLVRLIGARRLLEIGVFTGYSSTAAALALPPDGTIVACDISEEFTSVAKRYWKKAGVESKIDLRLAPAIETLADLTASERGSFDMAFIDADKQNYQNYFEACLKLVRTGGLIAIDNTLWSGRVADPANQEADTVAIRAFNESIRDDSRVWSCILPISDGLTLAVKK